MTADDFRNRARRTDYLAAADVALNPRVHSSGTPQKLLNYMAAAKPVVSFEGSAKGLTHERDALIVELKRAGANRLTGLCPFHDERSPSFGINPVDKVYYCFGCQASGDAFTFVAPEEEPDLKRIERALGRRLPRVLCRGRGSCDDRLAPAAAGVGGRLKSDIHFSGAGNDNQNRRHHRCRNHGPWHRDGVRQRRADRHAG